MVIEAPHEIHLAIIRKRFPGISLADMVLHAGGEHVVYVVEGMVSYRFPLVPRSIPLVRAHAIAWLAATDAIPFALPACEIEHDDEFDVWFERVRYLPGVPLTPEVAAAFNPGEMRTIARQMGEFLTTLHALPLEPARALGMDEMDPADFWDYMENNPNAYPWVRQTLWPVLPLEERTWIAGLFEGFIAQAKQTPLPLVIRHSDMQTIHIIVDPDTHKLSGVIDFAWRIADPAGDFKAFEHYGPEFVAEVHAHYGGSVDDGFEARRLFYTGHDVVFRLVRAYAAEQAGLIARFHAELTDYVRGHPEGCADTGHEGAFADAP